MRELCFSGLFSLEDIICLADALLIGGSEGSAPNLKTVGFENVTNGILAQLGSRLFARGASASITTLEFVEVDFDKHSMTDLVDGFRRSGHAGGTLQTLMFAVCNVGHDKEWKSKINANAKGVRCLDCRPERRYFPESSEALDPSGGFVGPTSGKAGEGAQARGAVCAYS